MEQDSVDRAKGMMRNAPSDRVRNAPSQSFAADGDAECEQSEGSCVGSPRDQSARSLLRCVVLDLSERRVRPPAGSSFVVRMWWAGLALERELGNLGRDPSASRRHCPGSCQTNSGADVFVVFGLVTA